MLGDVGTGNVGNPILTSVQTAKTALQRYSLYMPRAKIRWDS